MTVLWTSEQLGNPLSAEIWIDIQPDGRVLTGEGMPDWADGPTPRCGPFTEPGGPPGMP